MNTCVERSASNAITVGRRSDGQISLTCEPTGVPPNGTMTVILFSKETARWLAAALLAACEEKA